MSTLQSSISSTRTHYGDSFRHPQLNGNELAEGCKLGIDLYADTSCSGKYAYVEEFIEGKQITATSFSSSLGTMKGLPMANVTFAYDMNDGSTILLEHNNTIYLGNKMEDCLANPIQCEENGVKIDIRPKSYYPNETTAQTLHLADGIVLPLQYNGVLPFLPVRRPTNDELEDCNKRTDVQI